MSGNCLFPWCLPKSMEFFSENLDGELTAKNNHDRRRRKSKSLITIGPDGVLQIPAYRKIPRQESKLLSYCWSQDWNEVMVRCLSHPEEACHVTMHSQRTALHLATFNHACPLRVAQALLRANRHTVLVQDSNWYTPLHNVAFFPGESLVKLVCDTAIMVEQELDDKGKIPPTSGTSPLFLAAKRAAPLRTLRQLLETRGRTEWIAPSTGGEPYWMESLDEYSSPLEILLRDRAAGVWQLQSLPDGRVSNSILQPRLLWQMKLIANERLRVFRGLKQKDNAAEDYDEEKEADTTPRLPQLDILDEITTEQEMQALSLWSKCIELLAEHVPRLVAKEDEHVMSDNRRYAEGQFAILHCISAAKVPLTSLLQVALLVYPEQAMMRDEYGMLPLHHVLGAKHPYATKANVSMLLRHTPKMALCKCPCSGAYLTTPIGFALENRLGLETIKELLWADSDVTLTTIDKKTGLYPFAVAASSGYDLDVVYTLLSAHPQVLQHLCEEPTHG